MNPGRSVIVLAVLLATAAGCSARAGTVDDLSHALSETHSALGASIIVLDQLQQRRTTHAAAVTTVRDMATQVADARKSLDQVSIGSAADIADRDATASALDRAGAAVQDLRDALELDRPTTDRDRLTAADSVVTALRDRLQSSP